ncbi:MAG: hypothetical protein SFU87_10925 [Chitinophagaceae bacterium]|nr:hypothetical protein [Chitinophagaceae bacterium]
MFYQNEMMLIANASPVMQYSQVFQDAGAVAYKRKAQKIMMFFIKWLSA